jgi:hypothetical protein
MNSHINKLALHHKQCFTVLATQMRWSDLNPRDTHHKWSHSVMVLMWIQRSLCAEPATGWFMVTLPAKMDSKDHPTALVATPWMRCDLETIALCKMLWGRSHSRQVYCRGMQNFRTLHHMLASLLILIGMPIIISAFLKKGREVPSILDHPQQCNLLVIPCSFQS